jgi:hypothetical protein
MGARSEILGQRNYERLGLPLGDVLSVVWELIHRSAPRRTKGKSGTESFVMRASLAHALGGNPRKL